MNSKLLIIFSFLSLLTYVLSWGATGHMLTAQIAKNELIQRNPELYSRIEQVVLSMNNLTNGWSNSFVESASWADDVKGPGMDFWNNWHYVDRLFNPDGTYLPQTDWNQNILYALNLTSQVIKSKRGKDMITMQKAIMTRLAIHFLGDIHQPLHCSTYISDEFPSGDQGGNLFKITVNNTQKELHQFWDDGAYLFPYFFRPLNETAKQSLEELAESISAEFPRSTIADELADQNQTHWATQSFHKSQQFVYGPLLNKDKPVEITQDYVQNSYALIKKQIALGGYRLADLLENYYTNEGVGIVGEEDYQQRTGFLTQ